MPSDDLLTRLDAARGLGMGVCGEAAFRIQQLQDEVAVLRRSADKARADALGAAFEQQRQAAVKVQESLSSALASQQYGADAEDPETALERALEAVTAIAGRAEPDKVGAKLLDAANDSHRLQREMDDLRLARAASAGLDPDTLRSEGIFCGRLRDDPGFRSVRGWDGLPHMVCEGATVTLALQGIGPGAKTLGTIGRALMER